MSIPMNSSEKQLSVTLFHIGSFLRLRWDSSTLPRHEPYSPVCSVNVVWSTTFGSETKSHVGLPECAWFSSTIQGSITPDGNQAIIETFALFLDKIEMLNLLKYSWGYEHPGARTYTLPPEKTIVRIFVKFGNCYLSSESSFFCRLFWTSAQACSPCSSFIFHSIYCLICWIFPPIPNRVLMFFLEKCWFERKRLSERASLFWFITGFLRPTFP